MVDEVVHYFVTNMPGAVVRTSARALKNATLPFVQELADLSATEAMQADFHQLAGLNVCRGNVTYEAVAEDRSLD